RSIQNHLVGIGRTFDGKSVRYELLYIEFPLSEKVQVALHVAVRGPPYVPYRVVDPPLLVLGIVPTGTIGARHPKTKFLLVIMLSAEPCRHVSDHDDAAAVSAKPASQLDGII